MEEKIRLSDGRVTLRRCQPEDLEPLHHAVRTSMNEISPWMPWCHSGYSRDDINAWAANCDTAWAEGKEYDFAIIPKGDNVPVGLCGLNQFNPDNAFANLGYWIKTSRTKMGMATSATWLLARFAFDKLNLNRIEIVVATENKPSQRVAEKVGATREGILRNRLVVRDRVYDAVMYSLIPKDFDPQIA